MWNVEIDTIRVAFEGCPPGGIPAIDWRRKYGVFEEPDNQGKIRCKIQSEKIVREFAPNAQSADLVVKYHYSGPQHPLYGYCVVVPVDSVRDAVNAYARGEQPTEDAVFSALLAIRESLENEKKKISKESFQNLLNKALDTFAPNVRLHQEEWLETLLNSMQNNTLGFSEEKS